MVKPNNQSEGSPDDHDARLITGCLGVTIKTIWECEPFDPKRRKRLARNAADALLEMCGLPHDPTRPTPAVTDR